MIIGVRKVFDGQHGAEAIMKENKKLFFDLAKQTRSLLKAHTKTTTR